MTYLLVSKKVLLVLQKMVKIDIYIFQSKVLFGAVFMNLQIYSMFFLYLG